MEVKSKTILFYCLAIYISGSGLMLEKEYCWQGAGCYLGLGGRLHY